METLNSGLIEIWPPKGRERVALGLGARAHEGRYWVEASRQDENAAKLKKMFGTEAAKKLRDAALNIAAAQAEKAAAASASPFHPANQPANQASENAAPAPKAAQVSDILYSRTTQFAWNDDAAAIGATPGDVFVAKRAFIEHDTATSSSFLRIVAESTKDGASKEIAIRAEHQVGWKPSPLDIQASLEPVVARFVRHAAEPVKEAAPETVNPSQELMNRVLSIPGGNKGPAVEWLGENLDRPHTAAITGMRGVIISASMDRSVARSQTLKLSLDYRAFSALNATLAAPGTTAPSFETVELTVTSAEGEGLDAVAQKLGRTFRQVDAPAREVGPDHVPAAELRKSDERIQIAEAANAEVVRSGGTPPAPLPPVNNAKEASRVYFWTVKEDESPYCYKKLLDLVAKHGIPVTSDRGKKSEHFGLRFYEATQAQVAQLPDDLKFFLTEEARQARLESLQRRNSAKGLMADAAATAAIEVTSKRNEQATQAPAADKSAAADKLEQAPAAPTVAPSAPEAPAAAAPEPELPKSEKIIAAAVAAHNVANPPAAPAAGDKPKALRPIAVPHPEHDRDGWMKARAALYNIDPAKLVELMDLTWTMRRDLELKEDIAATLGETFSKEDERRLATWSHGLKLGEKVLEKKNITWVNPEQREAAAGGALAKDSKPAAVETAANAPKTAAPRKSYAQREG